MFIGYARIRTNLQDTNMQRIALEEGGCEVVFEESILGVQRERPELIAALAYMRSGDTLVVWKLDRLARSLKQLVETVEDLQARDIGFRSLTENCLHTTTAGGKLVFHAFAALAEFERGLIRERTIAGLAAARAHGRVGGGEERYEQDKAAALTLLTNPDLTVVEVAKRMRVPPATLYRHLPAARARATGAA